MAGECILVIEDDPDVRYFLARVALPQDGYVTMSAPTGKAALSMIEQSPPDLMLLDLYLPDINGIEVLKKLKAQDIDIPTIVITAVNSIDWVIQGLHLGVRDYVPKPFDPAEVLNVIRRVLNQISNERQSQTMSSQLAQIDELLSVRINHLNGLYRTGKIVTASLERQRTLNEIVIAASELTNADSSVLFLLQEEQNLLELAASHGLGQDFKVRLASQHQDDVMWQVVQTGQLLNLRPERHKVHTGYFASSLIYVPLEIKSRVIGVLGVYNHVPGAGFSDADEQILSGLADYAAIAIENTHLFAQTERRLEETQVLLNIGRQLARLLPEKDLIDIIVNVPQQIIPDVHKTMIHLIDQESNRLIPYASSKIGLLPPANVRGIYLDEGVAGDALKRGEVVYVADVYHSSNFVVLDPSASFRSLIVVPMRIGEKNVGTITVDSCKVNAFTSDDKQTLTVFANQVAVALNNMRLYQGLQQQYNRLVDLQQGAQSLGQMAIDVEISQVIARVNAQAAKLLVAEKCAILLYQKDQNTLVGQLPAYHVPDQVIKDYVISLKENPLVEQYWIYQDHLILNDLQRANPIVKALGLEHLAVQADVQHSLFAVLRVGGKSIGVIQVSNKLEGTRFNEQDAQLLTMFAPYAAIAIENVRLLRRFKALSDISRAITSRLDWNDILTQVIEGIDHLIDVEGVALWELQPDRSLKLYNVSQDESKTPLPEVLLPGEGVPGYVIENGKALILHAASVSGQFLQAPDISSLSEARTVMALPIQVRDRIWGVIELFNKVGADFAPEDQDLIEIISASVSIALENTELLERRRRQVDVMQVLLETSRAMSEATTVSLRALLSQIVIDARRLLDADSAVIYPYDPESPTIFDLDNIEFVGLLDQPRIGRRGISANDPAYEVRRKGVLVWEQGMQDTYLENQPFIQREQIEAMVGVHLTLHKESLGVLYINFRYPHHFVQEELSWVQIFAGHASIAIKSALLFRDAELRYAIADRELARRNAELSRAVNELEQLRLVSQAISSTLDLDEVMAQILDGAMQVIEVQYGSIMLFDDKSGRVTPKYDRGLSRSTSSFHIYTYGGDISSKRKISQVSDVNSEAFQTWSWRDWYLRYIPEARSALSAPIIQGDTGRVIGFINIGSPIPNQFSERDERLLGALASQAAVAIQNAQNVRAIQHQQTLRSQAERVAAQADIATNMVHRINNTVGAIRVYVQQIEARIAQGNLTKDYMTKKLASISENAEHTLEMARKIRQPFQVQPGDTEPIDVEQAILLALQDLELPATIQVITKFAPALPRVHATQQLIEVFHNLFKNAWEAMVNDGELIIDTGKSDDDKQVLVMVKDSGPGIEPERQEEIFRLGASSKIGNLGYGLWWTRTFLQRLGGDIQLESQIGCGCTFKVSLPAC